MFNLDFSVHALWGGDHRPALYDWQIRTVWPKNIKIETWMPLRWAKTYQTFISNWAIPLMNWKFKSTAFFFLLEIFCNKIFVFTLAFDKCIASWLNKVWPTKKKENLTYSKPWPNRKLCNKTIRAEMAAGFNPECVKRSELYRYIKS